MLIAFSTFPKLQITNPRHQENSRSPSDVSLAAAAALGASAASSTAAFTGDPLVPPAAEAGVDLRGAALGLCAGGGSPRSLVLAFWDLGAPFC